MNPTTFGAPWGRSLLVGSSVQAVFLLAVGAAPVFFAALDPEPGPRKWLVAFLGAAIPLVILVVAARYAVCGYTVTDDSIRVHRLGWSFSLPLDQLESATVSPYAMRRSRGELANGGLFSYTGGFHNAELGSYRAFVTDQARTVVLRFPDRADRDRVIVMSPDDPDAFVSLLTTGPGERPRDPRDRARVRRLRGGPAHAAIEATAGGSAQGPAKGR